MNQNNVWQEYLKAVPELQAPFEAQCRKTGWMERMVRMSFGGWGYALHSGNGWLMKNRTKIYWSELLLFEKMACASEEVQELLLYAVLEKLGDDKAVLVKARLLMGAKRWNIPRQVEAFWGGNKAVRMG